MKTFIWSLFIICISVIGIFTQSDAFDINLTQQHAIPSPKLADLKGLL